MGEVVVPAVPAHPILFKGRLVQGIQAGIKTETRRVIMPQPIGFNEPEGWPIHPTCDPDSDRLRFIRCPYGHEGHRLWVRETWADVRGMGLRDREGRLMEYAYHADCTGDSLDIARDYGVRWRPSIHMPREACRLELLVEDRWCEPLQEITEAGAKAEGAPDGVALARSGVTGHRLGFAWLWDSINAARGFGWDANPLVWVVKFRRVEVPRG